MPTADFKIGRAGPAAALMPVEWLAPGMPIRQALRSRHEREGWHGWDDYARFYDWENARTLGRRDVAFWLEIGAQARGTVLELGCGTGRLSCPLARSGVSLTGVDRSGPMLDRARIRSRRIGRQRRAGSTMPAFVRGDMRALPFADRSFTMVIAPYGVLQSLVHERDLTAALAAIGRVLEPGGLLGIDLVPDVPNWKEYRDRVQLRGRSGGRRITLVESVRQDRRRHLTVFDQRYVERTGRRVTEHRFSLTFRTLPLRAFLSRLARAGFSVDATYGDYKRHPWTADADTWLILARRADR